MVPNEINVNALLFGASYCQIMFEENINCKCPGLSK